MKYNQYAYVKTDYKTQVKELLQIKFLPMNYEKRSFSNLLGELTANAVAVIDPRDESARKAKLAEFAVSDVQTLNAFLDTNPEEITSSQFYNVALQLLGYHVGYDYQLNDPLAFMGKQALPYIEKINDKKSLIQAFYRLLNTRAKNGQLLIDVMAGQGYFYNRKTEFAPNEFLFFNGKSMPVFDTSTVMGRVIFYKQQFFVQLKVKLYRFLLFTLLVPILAVSLITKSATTT